MPRVRNNRMQADTQPKKEEEKKREKRRKEEIRYKLRATVWKQFHQTLQGWFLLPPFSLRALYPLNWLWRFIELFSSLPLTCIFYLLFFLLPPPFSLFALCTSLHFVVLYSRPSFNQLILVAFFCPIVICMSENR